MNELFGRRDDHESAILPGSKGIDKTMDEKETEVKNTGSSFRRRLVGAALTAGLVLTSCAKEQPTVQPSPQPSVSPDLLVKPPIVSGSLSPVLLPESLELETFKRIYSEKFSSIPGNIFVQEDGTQIVEILGAPSLILREEGKRELVLEIPEQYQNLTDYKGRSTTISNVLKQSEKLIIQFDLSEFIFEVDIKSNNWERINFEKNTYINGNFPSFFKNIRKIITEDNEVQLLVANPGNGGLYIIQDGVAKILNSQLPFLRDIHQLDSGTVVTSYGGDDQETTKLLFWKDILKDPYHSFSLEKGIGPAHLASSGNTLFIGYNGTSAIEPLIQMISINSEDQIPNENTLYLNKSFSGKLLSLAVFKDRIHFSTAPNDPKNRSQLTVYEVPLVKKFFSSMPSQDVIPTDLVYLRRENTAYNAISSKSFALDDQDKIEIYSLD